MGCRRGIMRAHPRAGEMIRRWVLLLLLMVPAGSWAQQPPSGESPTEGAPAAGNVRVREWVQRGSQKVVEVNFEDNTVIQGKVQKPGVEYLISQDELKYEGLPMEHDLVETLERSARSRPF